MNRLRAAILVLFHIFTAGGVAAQTVQGPPCGDTGAAESWAEDLEVILRAPDYADFRVEHGLPAPGAEPEVVTSQEECGQVEASLMRHLRTRDDWARLQRDGYTWVVIRVADRYLVPVTFGAGRNVEMAHGGHTLVLVFCDGEVVGSFLR